MGNKIQVEKNSIHKIPLYFNFFDNYYTQFQYTFSAFFHQYNLSQRKN